MHNTQMSQPPQPPIPQLTIILGITSSSIFPTLRDIEDRWGVSGSAMTEAWSVICSGKLAKNHRKTMGNGRIPRKIMGKWGKSLGKPMGGDVRVMTNMTMESYLFYWKTYYFYGHSQ